MWTVSRFYDGLRTQNLFAPLSITNSPGISLDRTHGKPQSNNSALNVDPDFKTIYKVFVSAWFAAHVVPSHTVSFYFKIFPLDGIATSFHF